MRHGDEVGERSVTTSKQKTNPKGEIVHLQIVSFSLKGISEEDYRRQCEAIASAFANLPGLVSKTWLANPETNTYGGVYLWQDLRAMEDYAETDLYKGMLANPHLDDITVRDFAVLENPTRVTRGTAEVAA
jgi:hypothetical protein